MADLVSILIPAYNQERFIAQAVDSALKQTHRELEVIVIDDGSTDGTTAVVDTFNDQRLRCIRQKNGGPSTALNTGIRASSGAFLAILGGDDLCFPQRIEAQLRALEEKKLDAVFCKPTLIDKDGATLPENVESVFYDVPVISDPSAHFRKLFYDRNYFCAPSKCFRRDVIDRIGLFHEGLVQLQDYDYIIRMTGSGMNILILDEPLIAYRRHAENLSGSPRMVAVYRELAFVYRHFLEGATSSVMRRAFADILDPTPDLDRPLTPDDNGFIYLSHSDSSVRSNAIEQFCGARRDQQNLRRAGEELLSFGEYFDLLNEAKLC